uniref:Menorin-like domain-containing protein n=1 Tax=Clastoptera arizonana TaxID=38151 RepID=A0A1B6DAG5_9HEMI
MGKHLVEFLISFLFGFTLCEDMMPVSVDDYFQLGGNLSKVTWAHAVNSKSLLEEALNGSIMMLEADVILGQLEGTGEGGSPIPVMGHPPTTSSDLSLEQFISKVISSGKGKGIKLDFKSKEVFQQSENIIEGILNTPEADFPFWLNADILPGPVNSETSPVDADYFLSTSVTKFPTATLSIGWTTNFGGSITVGNYTTQHIDNMTDALNRNHVTKPVTFPVRAGIAAQSYDTLTKLIQSSISGTTLTIWSPETDPVDFVALKKLIVDLGHDKVYIDIPSSMMSKLQSDSSVSNIQPNISLLSSLLVLFTFLVLVNTQ